MRDQRHIEPVVEPSSTGDYGKYSSQCFLTEGSILKPSSNHGTSIPRALKLQMCLKACPARAVRHPNSLPSGGNVGSVDRVFAGPLCCMVSGRVGMNWAGGGINGNLRRWILTSVSGQRSALAE